MNENRSNFFRDLLADLRDRRLLPLIALLAVAIVAVPFLLKSEVAPPAPATDPAVAEELEDLPTQPAVLASNPGLRDYRERLEKLRNKNPFRQPLALSLDDIAPVGVESVDEQSASASASAATEVDAEEAISGSSTGSGTTETSETPVEEDTTTTSSGETREYLIRHEITVDIDGPSEDREFEGVRELEVLPGKKTPLVVYGGVTATEKQAIFMLSRDIVGTDGDGSCKPSRTDCQLLTLGTGEQRKLEYAPDGSPPVEFVLKLHEIERVVERIR